MKKINYYILYLLNMFRMSLTRKLGATIGKGTKSFGKFTILNHEKLFMGESCTINQGVHLNCRDCIIIGDFVRLSTNVQIHTGKLNLNVHPREHVKASVIIESNVWLASGVVVSSGVRIGENSVVGANSVVLNDLEPNSLYAGNPAVKIRDL